MTSSIILYRPVYFLPSQQISHITLTVICFISLSRLIFTGFRFAGPTSGYKCACMNTYGTPNAKYRMFLNDGSYCQTPCTGNPLLMCGGEGHGYTYTSVIDTGSGT